MAENVIGDTTIRVGAESTVERDIAPAVRSIRELATEAERAGTKASTGLGQVSKTTKEITTSTEGLTAAQKRLLGQLERQSARTTMTASEYAAWRAQQLGLTTEAQPFIQRMRDAERATAAAGEATKQTSTASDRFVQALREQVETLGMSQRQLLEYRAAQMGVSAEAAPLIAKLHDAEKQLSLNGLSAGQTAAAMRMLPMQFTDIATSIAGGMPLYMIAIQQGGQIRDSFGGIGNSLRAIGSLINPFTAGMALGGAAVTAFAVAVLQGYQQAQELEKALIATGNAAGVSAGQLMETARKVGDMTGLYGESRAAVSAWAKAGVDAGTNLDVVISGIAANAELTGLDVADMAKEFALLAEKPTEGVLELNEKYRFLTVAVYEQIKALEEQGRKDDAAALAQKAHSEATVARLAEVRAQMSPLGRAWEAVGNAASSAWARMMGAGQERSMAALQERAAEIEALLVQESFSSGGLLSKLGIEDGAGGLLSILPGERERSQYLANLRGELDKIRDTLNRGYDRQLADQARASEQTALQLKIDRDNYEKAGWTKQRLREEDIKTEKAEWQRLSAGLVAGSAEYLRLLSAHHENLRKIDERYKDKAGGSGGITGATANELANIRARIEAEKQLAAQLDVQYKAVLAGSTATAKLTEGEKQSLAIAEKLKAVTDAKTKARLLEQKALLDQLVPLEKANEALKQQIKIQQDFEKERDRAIEAQIRETASITDKAIALEDEIAVYGLGKAAIEALVIARLESKRAALIEIDASPAVIEALNREIAARERLAKVTAQKEVLDANSKAAEEATRDWTRMTEQVGQSLTDELFDAGKSGKELVEDLFRTMILRPVMQPIVQGGMNLVGQALNIPGAPGVKDTSFDFGSLMGGGNISGSISNFADVAGVRLFDAGFEKVGNALVENSAAIGKFANGASQVFGYGKAIYDVTQGQYGSAIGTAIGTYILPGIGTAIGSMLGGMVDGMFGQPEARYGGTYTYRPGQGTERPGWAAGDAGPQAMQFADSLLRNASDAVQRAFAAAGSDALLTAFEASFESSEKGRGGTHSGGTIVIDGHEISFGTSRKGEGHGGRNGTLGEMMQAAEIDTYQSVIQGLQAGIGEFPRIARGMLEGVDADSLGLQDAQALIQAFVQSLEQIRALSDALGSLPWVPATAATFDFAAALAEAAGGAENAANLIAGFYQGYFTEAERMAHLTGQLTTEFAALGLEVPRTREEMRDLVQANMALGEAGAQTAAKLLGLGGSLLTLINYADQAAQATRQAAQKALDDAQQAAYAAAVAARQAAEQGAQDAMGILTRAVNREKSALQEAYDEIAEGLNTAIGTSQTALGNLESLATRLQSTLHTMLGSADAAMTRAAAQAQISQALSVARLTGVLPSGQAFENALQAVAQPSEDLFATFADYQTDFLRTANDIYALNELTGEQVSIEEQTLQTLKDQLASETKQFEQQMEYYDKLLETAQDQLDEAMGTKLAVMSLEGAMANFASAIAKLKATPVPSAPSAPEKGGYINDIYRDLFGRDAEQAGVDYWTGRVEAGLSVGDLERAIREAAGTEDRKKLLRGFAGGGYATPGWAMVGEEGPELVNFSQPGRVYTAQQTREMMAPPQWLGHGRTGSDFARLERLVDALTAEVQGLRAEARATAQHTNKTAKLIERAMPNGNAFAIEEVTV